jgi:HSP20 family molecular chaperone IbpA
MTASQLDRFIENALGVQLLGVERTLGSVALGTSYSRSNELEHTIVYIIPGVKREEVSISTENNILTIGLNATHAAQFANSYAKSSKSFSLSSDADLDNISATHTDGVLTVTVPRVKPKKKVRTVTVQ